MIELGYRILTIVWGICVFLAIYIGDFHGAMLSLAILQTSQILANQERDK